jgi:hypothetical protein
MALRTFANRGANIRSGRGFGISKTTMLKPLRNLTLKNLSSKNVYKKTLRVFAKNPVAFYLAGAAGAYFLGKFAIRYYQNHPQISQFIRDNMEKVESRIKEFRGQRGPDETATHH